jgi:G3E family GTPase
VQEHPEIMEDWDEQYGDRINQIVFIGKNLNKELVEDRLKKCIYKE